MSDPEFRSIHLHLLHCHCLTSISVVFDFLKDVHVTVGHEQRKSLASLMYTDEGLHTASSSLLGLSYVLVSAFSSLVQVV